MPNHVKNIVKMNGIRNLPLFSETTDGFRFDFEKIIPMPESLKNITSGTIERIAIEAALRKASSATQYPYGPKINLAMTDSEYNESLRRLNKTENELLELGARYIHNLIFYGATTWYIWSIENWGTKWNSYKNTQPDSDTIIFETAWEAPEPVIAQLAKMYPEAEIEHWWANENIGNNDGYAKYVGGEAVVCVNYECGSNEAYETYILCWGESDCLYKDENGIWHRRSCGECHLC